jgi:predicted dehydrogenase
VSVLSDKVDIANARLTFASGCVANVTASRVTGKIMQKIRFFGLDGYHAVDCRKRELVSLGRRMGADGTVTIAENPVEVKRQDPLEEEIRAFVGSVAGRIAPTVSGKDGRDALELALQINDAIKQNRTRLDSLEPKPVPPVSLPDGSSARGRVQT